MPRAYGMTKARKYVYIKLGKNRYAKARVMLRGSDEPVVQSTYRLGTDIVLLTTKVKKPPTGSKVVKLEDTPDDVRKALLGA